MSRRRILKSSSALIFLTLISRVFGLVREMVRASFLGTTALGDAFAIAFLIPNLLRRLFAEGTIAAAFIPVFKGFLSRGEHEKTKKFLSATFTFGSSVFVLTVLAGIFLARPLVKLFGPELDPSIVDEAVLLTRIMFPYLMFISISALIQGVLNSMNVFAPSGFTPILFNITFISSAYILAPYTENPARAIAVGVVAGGVLQIVFQIPFMLKHGYRIVFTSFGKALKHPGTRKVLRLIAPTVIGMGAYQINILFATRIANSAGTGVVSSLQFSNRLLELLLGIFAVSLGTVILPELAQNAKEENWKKLRENGIFILKIVALITLPSAIYTFLYRQEIVSLLFRMGAFDSKSVDLTAYALMFHIPGLFFIAVNRILTPVFYAHEDTRSPTFAGILTVVLNITLAYTLVNPLKGGGVALAASISSVINMLILLLMMQKKKNLGHGFISIPMLYSFKIFIFSVISILPVIPVRVFMIHTFSNFDNRLLTSGMPLAVGAICFFAILFMILYITGDKYLYETMIIIKRRNLWKK